MKLYYRSVIAAGAWLCVAACKSDKAVAPPTLISCTVGPPAAGDPVTLALTPLQGATVPGSSLPSLRLTTNGGSYLFVPQYAAVAADSTTCAFSLTAPPVVARLSPADAAAAGSRISNQQRLDYWLRAQEHALVPQAAKAMAAAAAEGRAKVSPAAAVTIGDTRTFRVLSGFGDAPQFATSTAQLKYIGAHIYVYVDVASPSGGFTDVELQGLGDVFDKTMYEVDRNAFGAESDIDQNQHVVVLLTPIVNHIISGDACQTAGGIITGFFNGFDLVNTGPDSNKGEIFYSLVPDTSGTRTCTKLSKERATELTLNTFIHEFQHMISYNQHVLVRGGRTDEDLWLNEGLSHIAEELGSLYYEAKYPAPTGRTDPGQLFPDSSQAFIRDNIADAYDYLSHTATTSVTMEKGSANPDERGAIWLFLRWLGDLKGQDVYRRLVQTNLTGRANVEAASGEPLAALLGDFGIALWTDSLPGVARSAIPARNRFRTRNLRETFKRLHDIGAFPLEYPLVPKNLTEGSDAAGSLVRGTMDFYILPPAAGATLAPSFTGDDGKALSAVLGAQLGVFRLPSP